MRRGLAERYKNRFTPWEAPRWWLDDRVLIGGSIQGPEDYAHLARDFGVTAVLSVENERGDHGVPLDRLLWIPRPDDGSRQPREDVVRAVEFARRVLEQPEAVLLCHCQQGGSRSPTYGYAVIRALFGATREEFLQRIRLPGLFPTWGEHPYHVPYMESIEAAVGRGLAG